MAFSLFKLSLVLWFGESDKAPVVEDFKSKGEKSTVHNYCSLFTFIVHGTVHSEILPIYGGLSLVLNQVLSLVLEPEFSLGLLLLSFRTSL